MEVWLIKEMPEPSDGATYWSNFDGFVDIDSADTFSYDEMLITGLPAGGIFVKRFRQWSVQKKDEIETMLIELWARIPIDIPNNYEDIVQDCYEDVCITADPMNWHSGDVAIAFRRWIESQTK